VSDVAIAALLGAILCGAGGLLVPALIGRLPEATYGAVAARPGLAGRAAVTAAVSGAIAGAAIGTGWPLLVVLPLVPVGVALAIIDLRTHLLPSAIIWPTLVGVTVLGVVAALLGDDWGALLRAVVGAAMVFAVFHLLWLSHSAGLGYGDVRLSPVLGFALGYVGWGELVIGIYGAFVVFSLLVMAIAAWRRDRTVLKVPFPFGPFLLGGSLVGLVVGDPIWGYLVGG
jgi:leader peptidase (prepilin peptidase)/N-methyltransferase